MKKLIHLILASAMILSLAACGQSQETNPPSSQGASAAASANVASPVDVASIKTTATATIYDAYHQISTVYIEYPREIGTAVDADFFEIIDHGTADCKNAYESGVYEGLITSVYTNSAPERREDKTSAAGNYIVIELTGNPGVKEDSDGDGYKEAINLCGLMTWRIVNSDGTVDSCDRLREDVSSFEITQKADICDEDGNVMVAADTLLPTLTSVVTPEYDAFTTTSIKNSKGYPLYFSYKLPETYDADKKYPLILSVTGGGGRLEFYADGTPKSIGGNITHDKVTVGFAELVPDAIVVSPQLQREPPYEYDEVEDTHELLQYIRETFSVDDTRIYGLSSSYGGNHVSSYIQKYGDDLACYIQCNSNYTGATTMFTEGGDDVTRSVDDAIENYFDMATYETLYAEAKVAYATLVENEIPYYIFAGYGDEKKAQNKSFSDYVFVRNIYQELGKTDEEIDKLLKINLVPGKYFDELGIVQRHNASKLITSGTALDIVTELSGQPINTVTNDVVGIVSNATMDCTVIDWMLQQVKDN